MKELLELKEKTEKEVNELYQQMQNPIGNFENDNRIIRAFLDKTYFLKLINIIYTLK